MRTILFILLLLPLQSFGRLANDPLKVIGGGIQNSATQEILQLACVGDPLSENSTERRCDRLQFLVLTDRSQELIGPKFKISEELPISDQITVQLSTLEFLNRYQKSLGNYLPMKGVFSRIDQEKSTIDKIQKRAKELWQFKPKSIENSEYSSLKNTLIQNSKIPSQSKTHEICSFGKINLRVDDVKTLTHLFQFEHYRKLSDAELIHLTKLRIETLLSHWGFWFDQASKNHFEFKASDHRDEKFSTPVSGRGLENLSRINLRFIYSNDHESKYWNSLSRPFALSHPIQDADPGLLALIGHEYFDLQSSTWDFWGMSCEKAAGALGLDPSESKNRIAGFEVFKDLSDF